MTSTSSNTVTVLIASLSAAAVGLLSLAAFGPRLYASQSLPTVSLAVEIVAVGMLILIVLFLDHLSDWKRVGVVLAMLPAWLLIAGWLAEASLVRTLESAGRLVIAVAAFSTIWVLVSFKPVLSVIFRSVVLFLVLGLPILAYLARDFGAPAGWIFHLSPARLVCSTFSH